MDVSKLRALVDQWRFLNYDAFADELQSVLDEPETEAEPVAPSREDVDEPYLLRMRESDELESLRAQVAELQARLAERDEALLVCEALVNAIDGDRTIRSIAGDHPGHWVTRAREAIDARSQK